MFFPPSSVNESPLSLLRFKFIEKSIVSASLFFSLFFFAVAAAADLAVEVEAVVAVVSVVAVVGFVICFSIGTIVVVVDNFFVGVFFFFPPLTTWVQPSSSLSGCSPVSGFGLSLVTAVIFVVAAAAARVIVVVVVVGVVVLVVF